MQTQAMMNNDTTQSKEINYAATAKLWRAIAHTAFVEGDTEAARLSHMRALENEMMDKEQKAKSK